MVKIKDWSGGDTKNSNDMLMMMLAFCGGKIDFSNPMMMYMFMSNKDSVNDMLMMMMLTGNNPFEQKAECKCMKDTTINVPCATGDIFGWTTEGVNINIEDIDSNT